MKFSNALFLTTLLGVFSYNATANTVVHVHQQPIEFTELPRLSDILLHVQDEKSIYWPTAALFRYSDTLLQLQQKTVADLQLLAELNTGAMLGERAKVLAAEIATWRIAERSTYPVYFERARLVASLNPRLTEGTYYLATPARNVQLAVFGATDVTAVTFAFQQQITDIFQQHALPFADRSEIWVIEADGSANKVGVAYWNKQKVISRPGQQFYIPFAKSKLPASLKDLNNDIVTLLQHRVISE
ncbi:capsule biosynthesis GfcC family protein [Alishewanella longhuensis]